MMMNSSDCWPHGKPTKNFFEQKAWAENNFVCGIDEVGRGCLAGPLVVGAVILPPNTTYPLLKDSKILTEEEREKAYKWIVRTCTWSIGHATPDTIDQINIYQATLLAMKRALLSLLTHLPFSEKQLAYVLIDAMPLSIENTIVPASLTFCHFNYGETFSTSIAAASIVAKVTRDRIMHQYATHFPGYDFEKHKGYGTKTHIEKLSVYGASAIHRKTFITNFNKETKSGDKPQQQTLF